MPIEMTERKSFVQRVLLVDDDEFFRAIVNKILTEAGYAVSESSTLDEAYLAVESHPPDVIVLDLDLTGQSGLEFLLKRKNSGFFSHIPVMMCSNENDSNIVKDLIETGVDEYLIKPIRQDVLLTKIDKIIRNTPVLSWEFKDTRVLAQLSVEAVSIGEAFCEIVSPLKFEKGQEFILDLEGLRSVVSPNKRCRVNKVSVPDTKKNYKTNCTLLENDELEAKKIRQYVSLTRRKAV